MKFNRMQTNKQTNNEMTKIFEKKMNYFISLTSANNKNKTYKYNSLL